MKKMLIPMLLVAVLPVAVAAQSAAPAPAVAATPAERAEPAASAEPATPSTASAPTREHLAPAGMESSYHQWHYTPVLKVGDQVIVSGIPAMVGETYEDKVRWMFQQLDAHLRTAGATLADVVELTSFHVGATDSATFQAEFARFAPIHAEFFPSHYPAWSAVGTTALLATGAPVELRAVAIIGSGRAPKADIPLPAPRPPREE